MYAASVILLQNNVALLPSAGMKLLCFSPMSFSLMNTKLLMSTTHRYLNSISVTIPHYFIKCGNNIVIMITITTKIIIYEQLNVT